MVARFAEAADPAIDSAAPDGFFFALAADEAWTDVEFFADEAGVLDIGRSDVAWVVASSGNAFVVFEVFDAGKGVLFVIIEFWWRAWVVGMASGFEPLHLDRVKDHATFV